MSYVSQKSIPYQMDLWNITCEGRSLPSGEWLAWKYFLEKNNTWVMTKNIRLELSKLGVTGDTIPWAAC